MSKTEKPRRNISFSSAVHKSVKKYADDNGMKIQVAAERLMLSALTAAKTADQSRLSS